jgi:aromatic-amino-acid transaminase
LTNPSTTTQPMTRLIPDAENRPGDDPIFALNAEAQRRAAMGETVINASLGALMEADGRLAVMTTVAEAFRGIDPAKAAAYAPIAGDSTFLAAVIQDVFGDGPLASRATAVATAGGTGAVHHAIVNFLEPGQALLTTNYYWGPYRIIAEHTRRRVETFPMLVDEGLEGAGRFDVAAFERALGELIEAQGRALVILNSPCHNPTGYTLDADEWRAIAAVVERAGQGAPVTLLLDLAYARYGGPDSNRWPEYLESALKHSTLLVAWSASKAFAQYGSRVGALIAVSDDPQELSAVGNALSFSCRGTWSNCNHLGLLAITDLLTNPSLRSRVDAERDRLIALLGERVEVFNREAARVGLRFPRYEGGFFVAVFTEDGRATAAAAEEEGLFVVPLDGAVRVALCSTPKIEVPRLVAILARAIEVVRR